MLHLAVGEQDGLVRVVSVGVHEVTVQLMTFIPDVRSIDAPKPDISVRRTGVIHGLTVENIDDRRIQIPLEDDRIKRVSLPGTHLGDVLRGSCVAIT